MQMKYLFKNNYNMKVCSKCKIEKKLTEFYKEKSTKDGLQYSCKVCCKKYYKENKEYKKEYAKKYKEENKEHIKKVSKKYREENKEHKKEYNKKHKEENKKYYKEYSKEYNKERRKTDPLFKIKGNLRNRNYYAFRNKGYSKNTKTQKMLGVDWEVAKAHIEKQFTKGMNWNNYGEWHIDHIIPLASANNKEEIIKLCHYTNLQPLWAIDNFIKSDKIPF